MISLGFGSLLSEKSVLAKYSQDPNPTALHKYLTNTYPDAVDSGKLARSLRAGELRGIYVPDSVTTEIRSLIRLRDSLTKDQTRHKNRIKAHLKYLGIDIPEEFVRPGRTWTNKFLLWLKGLDLETEYGKKTLDLLISQYEDLRAQQLKMLKEFREISHSPRFDEPLRLLMTIPGIGQVTGLTILPQDEAEQSYHQDCTTFGQQNILCDETRAALCQLPHLIAGE